MKRTSILVVVALLFASAFAVAEQATLIDFAKLQADTDDGSGKMVHNQKTVMDYSSLAGSSYTNEEKSLMKTSLAIGQWEVMMNSSSSSPSSVAVSRAVEVKANDNAASFAGETMMGVRIEFPRWSHNASAHIKPAFNIPLYEPMEEGDTSGKTRFEEGYGVVNNTGVIKSIAVNTYGMNFPHGLYVHIRNEKNEVNRYFMGYLMFDGWKELVWNNPSYLSDVRARETRIYPAYPTALPSSAFAGFTVTRDASHDGGPFIGYFKDVKIIYDKAVLKTDRDFADEDIWGIQKKVNEERKQLEVSRFGQKQLMQFIEKQKMADPEDNFGSTEGNGSGSTEVTTRTVAEPAPNAQ